MKDSVASEADVPVAAAADISRAQAHPEQEFGADPLEVRDSDHYTDEYVTGFVEKWDELIDWKKRYESEGKFFVDLLKSRGVKSVLDVATGTGFHSVRLVEDGFDTVSVDGSAEMLAKAFENGLNYGGHILQVVHADWRWLNRDVHGEFDAVVCLGNSFTHLFSERDRRKALAEFYAVLKHDGVLILDQRNYDAILDNGFSSKHTYYYCGEEVTAEPEYVDEGLARFRYQFPDKSQYHLNMFPLRKDYVRRLLREVGFQRVETFGDFQETFGADDPDFLIHVAEKSYIKPADDSATYSAAVNVARDYYNSGDADNFYYSIWGGEDIHVGLYESENEEIAVASRRTVERMAGKLTLTSGSHVLDIGSGYGGAARYLAKTFGCKVTCLNLSEVENERNRQFNAELGLAELIDVVDGSFEDLPFDDNEFDVVWSQDAMLHSGDRGQVLREVARVLKPKGDFLFTDPMAADDCDKTLLKPILDRLHLETMGSPGFYRREFNRLGMSSIDFEDHTPQLATHYGRVLAETERRNDDISGSVSTEYLTRMKVGLKNWVDGGLAGNLAWGIFHIRS
ncbi:SAM-dependent methyltransferase [Prauserella marina]|uniref:Sarcosine/dimethylglycine N-methyltransferase n=1 Tax=Prauserella marina TaxID=530584 RepID=A0A222VTX3_9PSEU|nr:methyltransferase domain-containing protein [Prauserella marina]ASR37358.1 SAM-dependent methyltransferase [Prauserella marina]PWV74778.1 glycine/sarcosine N-methyltransferase [Prauserella marina]SDD40929.1 sarcosine/dimethylglycine N-methyltransferase [Prauserella marina]